MRLRLPAHISQVQDALTAAWQFAVTEQAVARAAATG
jgi:hypothetical protein